MAPASIRLPAEPFAKMISGYFCSAIIKATASLSSLPPTGRVVFNLTPVFSVIAKATGSVHGSSSWHPHWKMSVLWHHLMQHRCHSRCQQHIANLLTFHIFSPFLFFHYSVIFYDCLLWRHRNILIIPLPLRIVSLWLLPPSYRPQNESVYKTKRKNDPCRLLCCWSPHTSPDRIPSLISVLPPPDKLPLYQTFLSALAAHLCRTWCLPKYYKAAW